MAEEREIRHLNIGAAERVRRYKEFYGGCVSDALSRCGVQDTVLSPKFYALRQDMILAGEALTVKLHSHPGEIMTDEEKKARDEEWDRIGSPQKRMMRSVYAGAVICFDTGSVSASALWGDELHAGPGTRLYRDANCREDPAYSIRFEDGEFSCIY